MPLEVPADPTAEAYATPDDADLIAERRESAVASAWAALESLGDAQENALITASEDIDTLEADPGFIGERADPDQEREWPRTGTSYSEDAWPVLLVKATVALALSYAPAYASGASVNVLSPSREDGNLKRKVVGPIEREWFEPRSTTATALERFPADVQRLLVPLLRSASTSSWGSAAVVRSS